MNLNDDSYDMEPGDNDLQNGESIKTKAKGKPKKMSQFNGNIAKTVKS